MTNLSDDERLTLIAESNVLRNEIANCHEQIRANTEEARKRQQADDFANAPRWDYRVENDIQPEVLNELGQQGWELVNVVSFSTGYEIGGSGRLVVHFRYFLKLPRTNDWPEDAKQFLENITIWQRIGREKYDEWEKINKRLGDST